MVHSRTIDFHGYTGCLELTNEDTCVIVGQHCGGRVLRYARRGQDAIALDPAQAGWTRQPGRPAIDPWGGRFDVGPEHALPPRPTLWLDAWSLEETAPGAVRLASAADPSCGLRVVRQLRLAPSGAHLRCEQIVTNVSDEVRTCCHWGRTIAPGGGIAVIPTSRWSRFPSGYAQYDTSKPLLDYEPQDPNVRRRDGFLEVVGPLRHPKLGFDSMEGWMAYLLPPGLLFVKRYPTFPARAYGEVSGFTLSLWLYRDQVCELEPIGPLERLEPGASASFTEDWWLLPFPFPDRRDALDLRAVAALVEREAR